MSRDTYRSRYAIYKRALHRCTRTGKYLPRDRLNYLSRPLFWRCTYGHVSFLISAAISVSNDRPYKLERLLSRVRETPPPREEEGRREQETAAALPPLLHFTSLSRCIRCPPISFELNSRATRFFKRRQGRDRDRQMTS